MNILDLIFPEELYCISCGRPLPASERKGIALCKSCADEIVWITGRTCRKCGRPLADENPTDHCHGCSQETNQAYEKGYACAVYSGRAAGVIRDMKYREKAWYANTFSSLMAARFFAAADTETGELPHYDYLVSVPMAAKKKASRGYDQADLLARGLSGRIGIPYLSKALRRVRETGAMSGLAEEERRQNLLNAFSVGCDMIGKIANKRILLVDDVFTTGSSVSACAEALRAAGAKSVDVIVFAIGADVRRHELPAAAKHMT